MAEITPILDPMIRGLVDAHPEPFALIDANYTIVACNRRYAEAYTHLAPEQIVGMKCHEVSHKSPCRCQLNGEDCPLDRVFQDGEPVQVIHRHFDREHVPYYVAIHGSPIADGQGIRYMGEGMFPISREQELTFEGERMVGACPSFMGMLDNLATVAQSLAPVVIHGETGTGKELAAQFLHRKSPRVHGPFVTVDCTTLTEDRFVDELFGHEAGAYTGCAGAKPGLVELAHGGTLFLDEIGEMPPAIQARFLRVLENKRFRRLGGTEERAADFRLISATHRDLKGMVEAGGFRADLYYRIHALQVVLPPLRQRRADIPYLVGYFLERLMPAHLGPRITPEALAALQRYDFPGNMRELKHIMERAVLLARHRTVGLEHLPDEVRQPPQAVHPPAHEHPEGFCDHDDPEMLRAVLARFGGNRRKTAAFLKISERTLYRRLRDFGIA